MTFQNSFFKFVFLFGVFLCATNIIFAQNLKYKYALRNGKKVAFFYTDSQRKPKQIYHRLSNEKEKTKLELIGDYTSEADYDTYGQIKVRNPKTKQEFFLKIDEYLVRVSTKKMTDKSSEDELKNEVIYPAEVGFELGKERLYATYMPVGFSAFYYMPNPQTPPQKMEIQNTEKVYSGEEPYSVNFLKEGKATIAYDDANKKLTVTFLKNKTKKVFTEMNQD